MQLSKVFTDRISSLLQDGEQWSDLTIECRGATFNVHRVIVCAQSKVLDQIVRKHLRQNPAPVAQLSIFLEINPYVLEELVWYFYTGDYVGAQQHRVDPGIEIEPTGTTHRPTKWFTAECTVWCHFSIYSAAYEYDIDHLKELSRNRLLDWMSVNQQSSGYSELIRDLIELSPDDSYMEKILAKIFSENIVSLVHYLDYDYDFVKSVGFLHKVLVEVTSDKKLLEKKLSKANEKIAICESGLCSEI